LIEIFQQLRHAHGNARDRKTAGVDVLRRFERSLHVRGDDQNRRLMQERFGRLFRCARINQASAQRVFRNLAVARARLQISPKKGEHIGVESLDRLTGEHRG